MSTWSTASNEGPKDSVSNFSSTRRKLSLCQTGHSPSNCSEKRVHMRNINGPRTTSLPKTLAIAVAFAAGVLCNSTTAFHVPNFLSLPCTFIVPLKIPPKPSWPRRAYHLVPPSLARCPCRSYTPPLTTFIGIDFLLGSYYSSRHPFSATLEQNACRLGRT